MPEQIGGLWETWKESAAESLSETGEGMKREARTNAALSILVFIAPLGALLVRKNQP